MLKILLLLCLSTAAVVHVQGGVRDLFRHKTTTTEEPPTSTTPKEQMFLNNNIPKFEPGCTINFECKKKLKEATTPPKPCVKYCVKTIECGSTKVRGQPDQCVELNEDLVAREYRADVKESEFVPKERVAMIDFPCQPGYLPDSRGRCREVW